MRLSKLRRISLIFLVAVLGILLGLFIGLNLPFSQRLATRQVNRTLTRKDVPVHINAIRKLLPGSVIIQGVTIGEARGDTIIYTGEIEAGIRLVALLRSKVVIRDLSLDGVIVDIGRESGAPDLNIAAVFQPVINETTLPSEKEPASWKISVNKGRVTNISFRMADPVAGIQISQDVTELQIRSFNVSIPDREIQCRSLDLNSTEGSVHLVQRLAASNEINSSPWKVGFRELTLADIDFTFQQPADSLKVDARIGKGSINANELDIPSKTVDLRKLNLKNARVAYHSGQQTGTDSDHPQVKLDQLQWAIVSNTIELENTAVLLGSEPWGTFNGIDLSIKDLRFNSDVAGLDVRKMNFDMANGFSLKSMKGRLDSDSEQTRLDLEIETGNSNMGVEGIADAGFFEILSHPETLNTATVELTKTRISLRDLSCFRPDLEDLAPFVILSSAPLVMEGTFHLSEPVLGVSGFSVSQGDHFHFSMEGSIRDPFQLENSTGDLRLEISDLDRIWLERLVNGSGFTRSMPDLSDLDIHAAVSDTLRSPDISVSLTSRQGNADMDGSFDFKREHFSMGFAFQCMSLGELLQMDEMGTFTGAGEVMGAGFTGRRLNADFFLQVDSLQFKDYRYKNALLVGSMSPGEYQLNMVAKDPSLKGDLNVTMTLADSVYTLDASAVMMAELHNLHIYDDTLSVESAVKVHLAGGEDELESTITASDITFTNPRGTAEISQLNTAFRSDTGSSTLHADADFFNLDIQFMQPLNELDSLGREYKSYFASFRNPSHLTAPDRISGLPEMNVTCQISDHPILNMLVGDSGIHFTMLDLSLANWSGENRLKADLRGDEISYNSYRTENLDAEVTDSAGIIYLGLTADRTSVNSGPENRVILNGKFSNWSTLTSLSVDDSLNQHVYFIEVEGRVDSNLIVFEIPSQQLTLNRFQWQTEGPGLLSVDRATGEIYPVLRLKNDSSFIHFNTTSQEQFLTYIVDLNRVDLASLIRRGLIPGRPAATFTGSINYSTGTETGRKITTGLQIGNIRYYGQDFSDIRLDGSLITDQPDQYSIDLVAHMDDSDFRLKGERNGKGDRSIDASFNHFPLITIQPFTREYVSDLGGFISGKMNVSNGRGRGQADGELDFEEARVKVNLLNSAFRIPSQRILLTDNRLIFNNFTVLDTMSKALKVDGYVEIGKDQPVTADLNISSSKLQVMSRDVGTSAPFTGNVFVDSRFSVTGQLVKPAIEGRIQLSEGTEIFYQHKDELRMPESEKLVSFVSHGEAGEVTTSPVIRRQSALLNSSIETIIGIDPSTRINFTLDSRMFNIDLDVKGGGQVQYNMLKNEQVVLSGRYEIGEGSALLHLVGWPDKAFTLAEGGYIRWDGRIENPELRFEAENRVNTSYVNPVDNKRRDIEFNVILQISGYLSDLNLLFTVRTPDQYVMSVINTMSPEEKMRQAIQVLLFETIDLPGISSSTDYMTQQVNQILASQLNQLTRNTIKGVDISFGLDSYDRSSAEGGGESSTSLSYEVKKSLFNNRGIIEVSGRLHDLNQQPGASDHSLNNVSFEYRLDSASTKYLKVYNEHTYDDVFEGEVTKTGIGFTYRKRYRTFSDIWKRKK